MPSDPREVDDPNRPVSHRDIAKLTAAVELLARRFRRSMVVRGLIGLIAAGAVVASVLALSASGDAKDASAAASSAAATANDAIDAIQADRKDRIAQSVKDMAKLESEVRELACTIVAQVPNDPSKPIIAQFRKRYNCPPYSKKRAGQLAAPSSLPSVRIVHVPGPVVTVTAYPKPRTKTVVRCVRPSGKPC